MSKVLNSHFSKQSVQKTQYMKDNFIYHQGYANQIQHFPSTNNSLQNDKIITDT